LISSPIRFSMPAAGDARSPVPRCRHRTTARPRAHRRAASGSGRSDRKFTIVAAALIAVTRGVVLGVVQLAQRAPLHPDICSGNSRSCPETRSVGSHTG
jgi:hypothetical protein